MQKLIIMQKLQIILKICNTTTKKIGLLEDIRLIYSMID